MFCSFSELLLTDSLEFSFNTFKAGIDRKYDMDERGILLKDYTLKEKRSYIEIKNRLREIPQFGKIKGFASPKSTDH